MTARQTRPVPLAANRARCKALVSVSGYLIGSPEAGKVPLHHNAPSGV
jgi:hypothetical protein